MKRLSIFLVLFLLFICACAPARYSLPLTEQFPAEPLTIALYSGTGQAYRFFGNAWQGMPSYNYEFTVVQKRYDDHWETVKEIHRRHPEYDGRAGPREQTLYFLVRQEKAGSGFHLDVESSWGHGRGKADRTLENIVIEFTPEDISRFAPFTTYRITQTYRWSEGRLSEMIEIFKKKNGNELPFMKMVEEAGIFVPMKPGHPAGNHTY